MKKLNANALFLRKAVCLFIYFDCERWTTIVQTIDMNN